MANFQEQLIKANRIDAEIVSKELFDFIRSIEKELVALNRDQLQNKSQDVFGEAIGFYSKATEFITGGSKKAGEPFDAYSTGDFLNKMFAVVENGRIVFGSTDPKTELILNSSRDEFSRAGWLSSDLFGLTDENLQLVIDTKFLPFIMNYYRTSLDL